MIEKFMNYSYTTIFSIKGINHIPDRCGIELVADSQIGLRAVLASQPNTHTFEQDRCRAVAGLMLRGLFGSEQIGEDFQYRVTHAVEELYAVRKKEFGDYPYLVVIAEGEVASFTPTQQRNTEDFVICFDGVDKNKIREQYQSSITAIINSITSVVERVIGIRKVADGIVFFREDGKPVYSYSLSAVSATAYVSNHLLDEQVEAIDRLYRLFAADTIFPSVQRLLQFSLEIEKDRLRSFLNAWFAFEIFTNKAFRIYKCRFSKSLFTKDHTNAQMKYLERLQNIKKDKYNLLDRFAAISFRLSPDTADDDLNTVSHAKKIRNMLLHGESVDETTLPVKPIRDVARKYVHLLISSEGHTAI